MCFNPTLVRLRQIEDAIEEAERTSFNPTLVRLRQGLYEDLRSWQVWFQSHAGSIEAPRGGREDYREVAFQSHAGSIEARRSKCKVFTQPVVSIPRWFD